MSIQKECTPSENATKNATLIIPNKKITILATNNISKVTTVLPTAQKFNYKGVDLLAIPHRLDEAKVLHNLGITISSPIKYYYNWPRNKELIKKPFDAQIHTAAFLTFHNRAFVNNEVGTGKSMSALWAFDYLRKIGKVKRALVVSPLSTLERTWADEIFNHFPHLTYSVLHGTAKKRLELLKQEVDVYIINHDGVEIIKDALKDRKDIGLVIIDEIALAARNKRTRRWHALDTVINKQFMRMAWGLTGTPTPNSPMDAWAQCLLLVPERVPKYALRFRDMVMKQVTQFKWVPRPEATEIIKSVMQPAIRFTRDECVDLPPVLYETRSVGMTPQQEKAYKTMLNTMRVQAVEGNITAVNEAAKMMKLVQIATGVAYDDNGSVVEFPATNRLNAVIEAIEQTEHKVIVFVPFVATIDFVVEHVRKAGYSTSYVHGGVSKSERDVIFTNFQKGDLKVLVAQPAAMSHGLTLTAANTIIWYAPVVNNETFEQANGRITRPGQRNNQFIIMLEGSPIERKIYTRLKNKQSLQGLLLDEIKSERAAYET